MLGNAAFTNSGSGSFTLGYSFTPSSNISVSGVWRMFGSKITIWTSTGTVVATQNVSGTDGVWTLVPLASPVILTGGTTYVIGAFSNGSNYYWNTTLGTTFANGTIANAGWEIAGDAFPTGSDAAR